MELLNNKGKWSKHGLFAKSLGFQFGIWGYRLTTYWKSQTNGVASVSALLVNIGKLAQQSGAGEWMRHLMLYLRLLANCLGFTDSECWVKPQALGLLPAQTPLMLPYTMPNTPLVLDVWLNA
jgi:hypothetical protein